MADKFVARLPSDLKAQLAAAAKDDAISQNALVVRALQQYLGQPDSTMPSGGSEAISELMARVAALEAIVMAPPPRNCRVVESEPNDIPAPPAQPAPRTAPPVASYSAAPPGGHPRADGGQWLTTGDAAKVSGERGGTTSPVTLKRWGKVADPRLDTIGLRYCPHGTRDKMLASFEDLRYQPE